VGTSTALLAEANSSMEVVKSSAVAPRSSSYALTTAPRMVASALVPARVRRDRGASLGERNHTQRALNRIATL
jgi:hypothetical protein